MQNTEKDTGHLTEMELNQLSQRYAEGEYFEGDLAISKQLIQAYYGGEDAAVREGKKLYF